MAVRVSKKRHPSLSVEVRLQKFKKMESFNMKMRVQEESLKMKVRVMTKRVTMRVTPNLIVNIHQQNLSHHNRTQITVLVAKRSVVYFE